MTSLFFKSISSPSTHFNISQFIIFSPSVRSSCPKLLHKCSRNNTTRHLYFTRLPRLWNRLTETTDLLNCTFPTAKSRLCDMLWSSFLLKFDSTDSCNLHHYCPCSRCIIYYINHHNHQLNLT